MRDENWVIDWIELICDDVLNSKAEPTEYEYDLLMANFDAMNKAEQRLLFFAVLRGLFVSGLFAEELERKYDI